MFRYCIGIVGILAITSALAAGPNVRPAIQCYSAKDTRDRIARLKLANPLILMQALARRNRAQPLRSRLCRRGNLLAYEFVLLRKDGKVLVLTVNARNGKAVTLKK